MYEEKEVSRLTGCCTMTQRLESVSRSWKGQAAADGDHRPISQPDILATAISNFWLRLLLNVVRLFLVGVHNGAINGP